MVKDDDQNGFDIHSTELFKYYSEVKNLIDKHKWYMSEKAGKDVGYERAVVDWLLHHATEDVTRLKKKYHL